MKIKAFYVATAVVTAGLVASACSSSEDSNTATSTPAAQPSTTTSATMPPTTPSSPAPGTNVDLQSLVVTPATTQRTDGPDSIHDGGIHLHFLVNGAPTEVMDAYKTALEDKGWSLTVQNSGGHGGGGGATYTGTNGDAFGVFTGGGYGNTTDVDACAWQSKPSNTNCGGHH